MSEINYDHKELRTSDLTNEVGAKLIKKWFYFLLPLVLKLGPSVEFI